MLSAKHLAKMVFMLAFGRCTDAQLHPLSLPPLPPARLFITLLWALGLPPSPAAGGWNREIERRADFQLPPRFYYRPA
jgi:hypothetical protein